MKARLGETKEWLLSNRSDHMVEEEVMKLKTMWSVKGEVSAATWLGEEMMKDFKITLA